MIAPQRLFVRGAREGARAHFGASPKCFSCSTEESCWRGANDSTRGRVRSPESEVEEFIEPIQGCARYRRPKITKKSSRLLPGNSLKLILIVTCHWAAREMREAERRRTQPWIT